MTNFDRIKGFTFQELVAFLEEVSLTSGDNMTNEACRHCRKSYDSCQFEATEEPETCRLLERSTTIEYWLNMSPNP